MNPRLLHCARMLFLILFAPVCAAAADPVLSVPQLMANKSEWDRLLNTTIRVEGRVSTVAKTQLRFIKCDLPFRLTEEQARGLGTVKNAEVVGRLVRDKDSNRIVFDVATAKPNASDAQQFHDREVALKNAKAEDWYALGEWAGERGRFYDDAELIEASHSSVLRGIQLEQRELSADNIEGRLALVKKAKSLGLPELTADELRHEVYRSWWLRATSTAASGTADLAALIGRAATDWPNSVSPLVAWPTDLQTDYARDPIGTYRTADAAQRTLLQRIFIGQAQLRMITANAASDGRNGGEIATRIEQVVPERRNLAEQYREMELRYRQANIGSKSKADALELAAAFRQRKQDDQATETLKRWLAARAQKLSRNAGAPEHLALADDYWSLLKEESNAVAHLEAARRLEPESEDVQTRYRELGYQWNGSRWSKPSDREPSAAPIPGVRKDLAIGLTSTEVRQIQGAPARIGTVISGQGADEYWMYGDPRGSRLVIQFHRPLHQTELRVVRIDQR